MADLTNLQVLKPSRKKPLPGDLFTMQVLDRFVFGRLILAHLPRGRAPMPGANLIYVYDLVSPHKEAPVATLSPSALLLPPVFINNLPWTRGYFENVGHAELSSADRLPIHCFRDTRGRYLDETGQLLERIKEPCGDWVLHSYRSLDDDVSDALGIPRAPE